MSECAVVIPLSGLILRPHSKVSGMGMRPNALLPVRDCVCQAELLLDVGAVDGTDEWLAEVEFVYLEGRGEQELNTDSLAEKWMGGGSGRGRGRAGGGRAES